jgi:diguanylate cyclase (GGDEF)-like protein
VKRLIPVVAIILGWASAAWAAPPVTLTTLRAIRALTNAEASRKLPVAFEATVTYYRDYENTLFVQDGSAAVFVFDSQDTKLVPGDRVLVEGKTDADFSPNVHGEKITLLRHGAALQPVPATFDELNRGLCDGTPVTVTAVVRAAYLEERPNQRDPSLPKVISTRLQVLAESGSLEASIDSIEDANALANLLDGQVKITGTAARVFDPKMQPAGVLLHVSSMADVKVLRRAAVSALSLPLTPMDKLFTSQRAHDLTQRVRVRGTITYYEPGRAVVLENGSRSLWIATKMAGSDLRINDAADATGFLDAHGGYLTLIDGEIWDSHAPANVAAQPAAWRQLASGSLPFGLISVEADKITELRAASQDEYVFSAQGDLFTAVYSHLNEAAPSMKEIPAGSKVRVTGIAVPENSYPFRSRPAFEILLRSPDDIVIVAKPALVAVGNPAISIGLMVLVMIALGARVFVLKRKVRRQAGKLGTMAYLEQRRTRILADINGSKPLVEILESITDMISFMLGGAPCWCGVNDGARLGRYPQDASRLHILHEEIPARSGPPLGTLFAGFDSGIIPGINRTFAQEKEVLSGGAKLAMLAIETRRLYSDLVSRSELDLLTNIPNRRSMVERLDVLIEEARRNASVFGVIYIDLDKFKPINDKYGHHVGDLFLQQVAMRMKQQLRSHDLLARLGGDEFAVLLPMVRNRTRIEEIALRLEHCFKEPFLIDGKSLQGAASFGYSIYPEDGDTRDSLLSAADAAMYVAKNFRKQAATKMAGIEEPAPVDIARV